MSDYPALLDFLSKAGLLGACVYFIYAASSKKVVFGYQLVDAEAREKALREDYERRLTKAEQDCERWRNLALEGRDLVTQAVNVAEKSK